MSFLHDGRWRLTAICLFAALSAAACSRSDMLMRITDPQDRAFAGEAVERFQACDVEYVVSVTAPQLKPRVGPTTASMCALLPKGEGTKIRLVDASVIAQIGVAGVRRTFLTYEIDRGEQHALVKVGVQRTGPTMVLSDLYAGMLSKPVDTADFSLIGKSPTHYIMLLLALAAVAVSVTAFILVLLTKRLHLQWLWAIGCLVSFGQLSIDWTSGVIYGKLLNVQLLGGFAMKLGISPWHVGFGIPIFAILFLIRRPELIAEARPRRPQLNL